MMLIFLSIFFVLPWFQNMFKGFTGHLLSVRSVRYFNELVLQTSNCLLSNLRGWNFGAVSVMRVTLWTSFGFFNC